MSVQFGVFGGSFDPPHIGHSLLCAYATTAYGLERVLVVPTHTHAFGKQLAPFELRVRMCELAFEGVPRVEISCIERELPAPSLTLRTLEALAQRYPAVQLRLLIGADLLAETSAWHRFDRIAELAPPIVVQRQGHPHGDPQSPALPDVSSTEIRRRLRAGQSAHGLLAPAVERLARSHGLYSAE